MITALRIQNFAIVEEVEVRFSPGFNAVTGETGAGKSLLVDALHLILGGRASTDVIRTGAEEATVEALFEGVDLGPRLEALGLPVEGGELLIRRVVQRTGRGRVWINGALATVGLLEQLARGLVDISGQHEHISLLRAELHLDLVDAYAGLMSRRAHYREAFDAFQAKRSERRRLALDDAERARRSDYLSFQIEEIDAVDPGAGELEALASERRNLATAEKQKGALRQAEAALYSEDGSAVDRISASIRQLEPLSEVAPEFEAWLETLRAAQADLEELSRTFSKRARGIEADPARLEAIDDRIEQLKRLCRKHGGSVDQVLARRDEMRRELDGLVHRGELLAALEEESAALGREALSRAQALSEARREAALRFARAVEEELRSLAMDKTRLEVSLSRIASGDEDRRIDGQPLDARGLDACELLLSPNRGEALKPLSRIASGGELSRILLAIKRVLARVDPVSSYVFDEIDTGISGATAEAVGRALADISAERQVIAVTHLPQIAVFAERHFCVEKEEQAGRVASRITALSPEVRVQAIARMLAGAEVTPAALGNAEALFSEARRSFSSKAHRTARPSEN